MRVSFPVVRSMPKSMGRRSLNDVNKSERDEGCHDGDMVIELWRVIGFTSPSNV
jgi:hypothetical protein